jgi:hypothetical protein
LFGGGPYRGAVSRRALIAVLGLLLVAVGCARESDQPELPVLPGTTSASVSPGIETTLAMPTGGPIPEFCDEVIPFTDVARIVAAPISGGSSRTYATDFSEASGRTARLTCQYGVQPSPARGEAPPPQVTISLSQYVDAAAASSRLEDTVGSARSAGQQVEAVAAATHQAYVLTDDEAVSYVAVIGDRTVVVTLARQIVPAAAERVVLLGLAEAVLGIPVATRAPSTAPSTP